MLPSAKGKASGGNPEEKRRGVWFTPGQAHILFWSLVLLGTGILALLKNFAARRAAPEEKPPVMTVSPDVFEKETTPAEPGPKKAPAQKKDDSIRVFIGKGDEDAAEVGGKKAGVPPREAESTGGLGASTPGAPSGNDVHEVRLDE